MELGCTTQKEMHRSGNISGLDSTATHLASLIDEIRACKICVSNLPFTPNPVLRAAASAKLLIVGQAPGRRVHETSVPFNDPSGDRLREWLDMDRTTFYDVSRIAIVPMGFCYPGTGRSGDLAPRRECADTWRARLLAALPNIELTLAIGQYAQRYHLRKAGRSTLTESVKCWKDYAPHCFPLPHPSPRNNIWLKKNPWFQEQVIPALREAVNRVLDAGGQPASGAANR